MDHSLVSVNSGSQVRQQTVSQDWDTGVDEAAFVAAADVRHQRATAFAERMQRTACSPERQDVDWGWTVAVVVAASAARIQTDDMVAAVVLASEPHLIPDWTGLSSHYWDCCGSCLASCLTALSIDPFARVLILHHCCSISADPAAAVVVAVAAVAADDHQKVIVPF